MKQVVPVSHKYVRKSGSRDSPLIHFCFLLLFCNALLSKFYVFNNLVVLLALYVSMLYFIESYLVKQSAL